MKTIIASSSVELLFMFCALVLICTCGPADAAPWTGGGTEAKPYLIKNAQNLQTIGAWPKYWSAHFELTADIDMSGSSARNYIIIGYYYGSNDNKPFTGTFEGNGHTISNFSYVSAKTDGVAMFGYLGAEGEIRNLALLNANINAAGSNRVAALVAINKGSISNCCVTGSVTAGDWVGGIVGINETGAVSNCYSTAAVTGTFEVGGLAGGNGGQITNCYAAGPVTGTDVGGFVGLNTGGQILNCFWDKQTSDQTGMCSFSGGTGCLNENGKTTAQMKTRDTFVNAGWDFIRETANGTDDVWKMTCGADSYPKLHWWQSIPGDLDCPDGVDFVDFAVFADNWEQTACGRCGGADLTGDGNVNFDDLAALVENWLAGL